MTKVAGVLAVTLIGGAMLIAPALAESGAQLFEQHCNACHGTEAKGPDRVAPPIFAIQNHYSDLKDDKDAFVKAIASWILKPDAAKTRMPGAIRKFELMQAVEMGQDEAEKIAEFVYETDFQKPDWYKKHYREEHGKDPE